MAIRYWLVVAPLDRVRRLRAAGVVEMTFGGRDGLEDFSEADGIVFYSPRYESPEGERLRAFTAIGRISDGRMFLADQSEGSRSWRRRVDFMDDTVFQPVRPLVGLLEFTRDRRTWGQQLRRGILEISRLDFETIRDGMRLPSADERPPHSLTDRVWY